MQLSSPARKNVTNPRRHTKRIRCYDLDNYSEKNYTFVKILYSGVRSLYDFWKADNKF